MRLEIEPNRELGNTVSTRVTEGYARLSEGGVAKVAAVAEPAWIFEVGMVEQVKEVGIKPEAHPFIDFEGLADSKINVREHRTRNRVPLQIRVTPEAAMRINSG